MTTTYEQLLERVISDGIIAAREDYADGSSKQKGAVAGFEACRDKTPTEIVELWQAAGRTLLDQEDYWYHCCYQAELEWCLNVLSAGLSQPLLGHLPTARGVRKYAERRTQLRRGVVKLLVHRPDGPPLEIDGDCVRIACGKRQLRDARAAGRPTLYPIVSRSMTAYSRWTSRCSRMAATVCASREGSVEYLVLIGSLRDYLAGARRARRRPADRRRSFSTRVNVPTTARTTPPLFPRLGAILCPVARACAPLQPRTGESTPR